MENQAWSADSTDELGGHGRAPFWIILPALLLIAGLLFALRPSSNPVTNKVIGSPMSEVRLQGLTGSDR